MDTNSIRSFLNQNSEPVRPVENKPLQNPSYDNILNQVSQEAVKTFSQPEILQTPIQLQPVSQESAIKFNSFDEPYNPKGIERSYLPSVPLEAPSTDVSRSLLGIDDPNVKLTVLHYKTLALDPIVIDEIVDKHGQLSELLERYEDKYKVSVIPLELTSILPQVSRLARHTILTYNNKRYASGSSRIINELAFREYTQRIVERIKSGCAFVESLWCNVTIGNRTVKTLRFNNHELEVLHSLFRNFSPKVVETSQDDIILVIGQLGVLDA